MNPSLAARLVLVALLTSGLTAAMPNAASTAGGRSTATEAASARRATGSDYYAVLRGARIVGRGTSAYYELTIRGAYRETAQISIELPDSVGFEEIYEHEGGVDCTPPPVGESGTIECSAYDFSGLDPRKSFAFSVSVPQETTALDFVIRARVSGSGIDPELSNNVSEVKTGIVDASSFTSDVSVSFKGQVRTTNEGDAAFLRLVNRGPEVAVGIRVEAGALRFRQPSRGVVVRSVGDSVSRWHVDALGPNESATLVLQTYGGSDSRAGSFRSSITGTDSADANASNNSARIHYSYEPFENCAIAQRESYLEPSNPVAGDTVIAFVDTTGPDGLGAYFLVDIPVGTRLVKTIVRGAGTLQAPPLGSESGTAIFFTDGADAGLVLVLEATTTVRGLAQVLPVERFQTYFGACPPTGQSGGGINAAEIESIETVAWDPPDPSAGDDAPPRSLRVGEAAQPSAKDSPVFRRGDATLVGYNIYRSHLPNVAISPSNLFASVGPTQTSVVVPTAPGGSFFRVAACYATGEGGASNEAEESGEPGPRLTKAVIGANGITAKGSGFTEQVNVSVDGIPFVRAAKVKAGNAKVKQTGDLLIGLSVSEYLRQSGPSELKIRNSDGRTARVRIQE